MDEEYDDTAGPSQINQSFPITQLCKDKQCDGFDFNMGSNWIFPTNKPLRNYQNEIIQKGLYNNTLVVLPTGLGKTFIAAVIIYNFYRWYPRGKIIFVAPTKPLVFQQKTACLEIMGISIDDTVEFTGQLSKEKRYDLWKTKRVFFATPQVVENDLSEKSNFPFSSIKLIIFDEAHKAKGKYSYCQIVRRLNHENPYFRVLALSATPGRNITDVVEIIQNLQISHIELRHIDSPDISAYVHKTNIVTEVVELDEELKEYRKHFLNIIRPYVDNLKRANAIIGTTENLSKNWLIMQQIKFNQNFTRNCSNFKEISTDFSLCISLYHGLELLVRNGIKVFNNFFTEDNQKMYFCFQRDSNLIKFLDEIKFTIQIKGETFYGHPKFEILREKLLQHFLNNPDSKAIVFCEYRFCVSLILNRLKNCVSIKPKVLVGQSSSSEFEKTTQKAQKETLNDFKSGLCNVLISTSVGEEGLDIGEVDLIVCFDINTKNSSRFVQRIGRTGRKRSGNVVMLVTKGKEEENLREALKTQNKTNNLILTSSAVTSNLFQHSHRLVPQEFNPKCLETFMTPASTSTSISTSSKKETKEKKKKIEKKPTKNLNSYFTKITKTIPEPLPEIKFEVLPTEHETTIIISDEDEEEENIEPPKVSSEKSENLHEKINLFEKRLDENKFYSSIVKNEKNEKNKLNSSERFALIDVTNLICDVDKIREEIQALKVEEVHVERKTVFRIPDDDEDHYYRFSQNISNFMNTSKLTTWSSPSSSDRFDLNINSYMDIFEGSWKSEGNMGNLDHWKNCSRVDNSEKPIIDKNDFSDILSQSVLNLTKQPQSMDFNEDFIQIPGTPKHMKQASLSPGMSPSIFDAKKRRRRIVSSPCVSLIQSSMELSRKDDMEVDESIEDLNNTQELHESKSASNDLEIIESSQKSLEIKRPRLRRLLFEGNQKKSPKKSELINSSLKNDLEKVEKLPENNSSENSIESEIVRIPKKVQKKRKRNSFIMDEAINDSEDSEDETEQNDSHFPDDSVIDHTFDESAFNSTVDMRKIYLESIKLPIQNQGFKIPERKLFDTNIFSQAVLPDESILDESFVDESVQMNDEEDELDRAEALIKEMRRKRKRGVVETSVVKVVKKRRYYVVSSDSSQD